MARIANTLFARLVLAVLAIQVLLAPLLYVGVIRIVEASEIELFVNDVRAYSRFLGDVIEAELPRASEGAIIDLLDSIVLSHETTYAALVGDSINVHSSLIDAGSVRYEEDFAFGEHADATYFLSIPLSAPRGDDLFLRLGFDERSTNESLATARSRVASALALFVVASLALVAVLGGLLVRPLRALQRASQIVASGSYGEHFAVKSTLSEIRDLTLDLERMRESLVQTNQRLTTEIGERKQAEQVRAALERKLRHVQKLETIGTLAGGIAHEFNNVLVPIKLYTELALEDLPRDSPIRADLERVLTAATRAKNVVQKILTFSRQSNQEHYAQIALAPIVEDALKLAGDLFPSTIVIESDLSPTCPRIFGDETQLHQLVMNVLNNAYQAIGERGGTITVTLAARSVGPMDVPPRTDLSPGEYVVLAVADTGHGLDAVERERIFEPFYTTRPPGEGTGLGLPVVHGIVSGHGGAVSVESERGRGSTFTMYFPVVSSGGSGLSNLGLNNVLYVAVGVTDAEHRVAVAAMGGRARAVASRAELRSLLALEEGIDLLILDFSTGTLSRELRPEDVPAVFKESTRLLLLGTVPALWQERLRDWPHADQLESPLDGQSIRAKVQSMLSA